MRNRVVSSLLLLIRFFLDVKCLLVLSLVVRVCCSLVVILCVWVISVEEFVIV